MNRYFLVSSFSQKMITALTPSSRIYIKTQPDASVVYFVFKLIPTQRERLGISSKLFSILTFLLITHLNLG